MIYIKKKLVIFLIATIPILLIYKITINKTYTYLSIGDDLAKGHTPFNTYNMSYTDYLYKYLKEKYPEYSGLNYLDMISGMFFSQN